MKNLFVDRASTNGTQVMMFGEGNFATITDGVFSDLFAAGDDVPEIIQIEAITEAAWIFGDDPVQPADFESGYHMAEGMSYPTVIPGGKKLAVKGTIAISW